MWVCSRSTAVLVAVLALVLVQGGLGPPFARSGEASQTASEEFSIFYESIDYGPSYPEPYLEADLVLRWNGEYYLNFTSHDWPENESASGSVSPGLALSIFEVIMEEGFCDMLDRYRDLGTPEDAVEERLTVACTSADKSVSFGGYSMMGLMPGTWMMLDRLLYALWTGLTEPLEVSLEISVAPGARPTETDISLSFTNNEEFMINSGAMCEELWPVRIVRMNGCSAHDFCIREAPLCTMSFEPGTTTDFDAQTWNWSGVAPGFYVAMVMVVVSDYVIIEVPDSSGATNKKPIAEFTADPAKGNKSTYFKFDATLSCDFEDNCSDLKVRWDWNGDGEWDTAWSPERVCSHTYADDGRYSVVMEVMDSDGLTNETSLRVTVGEDSRVLYFIVLGSVLAILVATAAVLVMMKRRSPPKA